MAALSIKRRKSAHPIRWGMQSSKSGSPALEKLPNVTLLGGSTGKHHETDS